MTTIYKETMFKAALLQGSLFIVRLLCMGLFLTVAIPATSAAATKKPATDICVSPANEANLLACRQAQADKSDAEVKSLVMQFHAQYRQGEPVLAKALLTSQNAWLGYREAKCRVRTFESQTGSAFKVYWLACMHDMNQARLRDLRDIRGSP